MMRNPPHVPVLFDLRLVSHETRLEYFAQSQTTGELHGEIELARQELLERPWDTGRAAFSDASQIEKGHSLFRAVFRDELLRRFDRCRGAAVGRAAPFVLRLRFDNTVPLSTVPWELMHDGFDFLARDRGSTIVRYLEGYHLVRPLRIEPPLRILVTGGKLEEGLDPDLESEHQGLDKAYQDSPVPVAKPHIEANVSFNRLEQLFEGAKRDGKPFHLWHHIGHGLFYRGQYCLHLTDDEPVGLDRLRHAISACPSLQMLVFATCHGAALEGAVPELAKLGLPLVLGFRQEIDAAVARKLTSTLHGLLIRESPEIALASARSWIAAQQPGSLEWSQVILYSRRQEPLGPLMPLPSLRKRSKAPRSPRSAGAGGRAHVKVKDARAGRDLEVTGADASMVGYDVEVDVEDVDAGGDLRVVGYGVTHARHQTFLDVLDARLAALASARKSRKERIDDR